MTILGKPVRRIVTADINGYSLRLSDEAVADIRRDPARPGFESSEIWVHDGSDNLAAGIALTKTHRKIQPPPNGSLCRIVTFPPDSVFEGKIAAGQVAAYFASTGSPEASTYSPGAPHPYMQKTATLDFCLVLKGRITLVLDTQEVELEAGDTVVQRGTNHAWSNRSSEPCTIAFTLVDGVYQS
jgi:mannose-6-phosphate isomerase-like protein (cupin superfamily)